MNRKSTVAWATLGLLAVGLAAQPFRPAVVRGGSMAPTYRSGEWLLTEPLDRPLRRGDVVIADLPSGPIVKRVALLSGDRRVQFRSGTRWVDLTTLSGPRTPKGHALTREIPVPEGTAFLLGDNLDVSVDSRSFGPIPLSLIRRLVVAPRDPDVGAGVNRLFPRRWLAEAAARRAGA